MHCCKLPIHCEAGLREPDTTRANRRWDEKLRDEPNYQEVFASWEWAEGYEPPSPPAVDGVEKDEEALSWPSPHRWPASLWPEKT